jgi:hypothetical protein
MARNLLGMKLSPQSWKHPSTLHIPTIHGREDGMKTAMVYYDSISAGI